MQLKPVSLRRVMDAVLELAAAEIKESRAQVCDEVGEAYVQSDERVLSQVITNLLTNSLKFVATDAAPDVRLWVEAAAGRVRLWIEDRGIGIAPEHQERIFEVFERLHSTERYPGTGIGLAIVRMGMERMGGRFGVDSLEGAGSRFWIELPAAT